MAKYGDVISKLRDRNKLTQEELAKRVGISRAALSHYEKNRREPDYETLERIADYFEVNVDYLLGRTNNPAPVNADEKDKTFFMSKIATEFPDIDLMFKDMESMDAEEMKDVYEYIKFKKSQKKGDN